MSFLKHYRWDLLITLIVGAVVVVLCGPNYLLPYLILLVLEVSLSFDNAVVNATVLERLSKRWQNAFMFVGIWIAVFGMRFVFPILIVGITTGISFGGVLDLALHDSHTYATQLEAAHPEIATLGGVYLGMIFLNYFLGEHESFWIAPVERALVKIGKADTASALIMTVVLLVVSQTVGGEEGQKILFTGAISLALYLGVQLLSSFFENKDEEDAHSKGAKAVKTGVAGIGLFVYLEVQDAAFSFDGVTGAFAITDQVLVIAAGLGIGALFVRSMTIHLVRTKKLAEFPYLENGAHWAIGALAVCILASLYVEIPEWVIGLIGVVFILASVWSSHKYNKAQAEAQELSVAESVSVS